MVNCNDSEGNLGEGKTRLIEKILIAKTNINQRDIFRLFLRQRKSINSQKDTF